MEGGPLNALSQMHRAIRETGERVTEIDKSMESADAKLQNTVHTLNTENAVLRTRCSDLEEITIQAFREHDQKLRHHHDLAAAQYERAEAQIAVQSGALQRCASQMEAANATIARQQALLDELIRSSAAQSHAVDAQLKVHGSQQAADASSLREHVSSVVDKLAARFEAHAIGAVSQSGGWEARFEDMTALLRDLVEREGSYRLDLRAGPSDYIVHLIVHQILVCILNRTSVHIVHLFSSGCSIRTAYSHRIWLSSNYACAVRTRPIQCTSGPGES